MYECMKLFGPERAELLIEMVREATGGECPCMVGKLCPLVAPEVESELPTQRVSNPEWEWTWESWICA